MTLRIVLSSIVLALTTPVALRVQETAEACRVDSFGRPSGTASSICQQISERWSALFGVSAPSGVVRLTEQLGYGGSTGAGRWTLNVPASARTRPTSNTKVGILKYYADNIITHEAGHSMLAVHGGEIAAAAIPGQYGTQAPDWFDEAVAVWMESAPQRTKRVADVARLTPSLQRLVTIAHPGEELVRSNALSTTFKTSTRVITPPCDKCVWLADSLRKKYQIVDVGTNAAGRPDTIIWYADRSPMKDEVAEQKFFYPLSYALLRFIRERGGSAAVRELMSRYRIDPRPRAEVLSALPGLPASVSAFEKSWHEFLANMPAERN